MAKRRILIGRKFAWAYFALVVAATAWAWYIDIKLIDSSREHLLPDLVHFVAALPSSISVLFLSGFWPNFFDLPFVQLSWVTLCGFLQAGTLFWLSESA